MHETIGSDMDAWLEAELPGALRRLRTWVETNTHTPNKEGVARHAAQVEEAFAPLGFTATRPEPADPGLAPHLFLTKRGAQARGTVALISHLDTVFPASLEARNNFSWREAEGRIYGPGTSDIKGGTLVALLTLQLLHRFAPDVVEAANWVVAMNSSEEILNPDFGRRCREHLTDRPLAALVFEMGAGFANGEGGNLVISRKGRVDFRVTARGLASHAGGAHPKGVNAIRQLARTVEDLEKITDYGKGLTLNIGKIEGGIGFNAVPHEASMILEMRAPDTTVLNEGVQSLYDVIARTPLLKSGDGEAEARLTVEELKRDLPWDPNPGSLSLLEYWQHAARDLGMPPVSGVSRGGLSDGNLLWDYLPTMDGLGPDGGNAHCAEWADGPEPKRPEYAVTSSFAPKAKLNFHAISKLVRESRGNNH